MNLPGVRAVVVRAVVIVMVCAATSGAAVWASSFTNGPGESSTGTPPRVPPPRVAPPQLERVPGQSSGAPRPDQPVRSRAKIPDAGPDPLAGWAEQAAELVRLPPRALAGYGRAELAMRRSDPGCHLSWVTVAAVDSVRGGADGAALAIAEALCAAGEDTSTREGWWPAVSSLSDDPTFAHKVLAAATTYATAMRTGVPLRPAAREAIDFAIGQIGLPYVWGGDGLASGEAGFDCSGLTHAAYAAAGVDLPRTAHTQFLAVPHVQQLRPGDLVFYGNPNTKIHHVGLYIGNGQMINAPNFGEPVQVEPVRSSGLAGAGRPR